MGLFGGGSSDSASSASQTGSQTQQGDPISISSNAGDDGGNFGGIFIRQTDHRTVGKSFDFARQTLNFARASMFENSKAAASLLDKSENFATDTLAAANELSSKIIDAGKYQAGATERIAEAFQSFVDEQNNPNEKNQMLLIMGAVGVLGVIVYMVTQ